MTKFPKTITVQANGENKFFYGKRSFLNHVSSLLFKGLKSAEISDLVIGSIVLKEFSTHYHYYIGNGHISTCSFASKFLEGEIEVKHWGKTREGGQIERIVIKIAKCEVPKVVFT